MQEVHPLVTVNLLTWNGEKYLRQCLNSVFNQTYQHLEINVLDNNSTDQTVEILKHLQTQKNFSLSFNKNNEGFAKGHNALIAKSKGDLILCLNQDLMLDARFIERVVSDFKKDDKIGAVQAKINRWSIDDNRKTDIIDTTGLVMLKNRRIINRGQGVTDKGQFERGEVFGADGASPVYRRSALDDIKIEGEYFDETFQSYKEDVDLAWRLRLYGWKTVYNPDCLAWHDRSAGENAAKNYFAIIRERRKIEGFRKMYAFRNQRLMQIKNEQLLLLLLHLPWFLPKEIASLIYVLIFEKGTYSAISDLFKKIPLAFKKRRIIMQNKKVGIKEMSYWFK